MKIDVYSLLPDDVKDYLSENDRIYDILRSINEDDKDYPMETEYE